MGGGSGRVGWGGGGPSEAIWGGGLKWGGGGMPSRPSVGQPQAPLTSPCLPSNHTITLNRVGVRVRVGFKGSVGVQSSLVPMERQAPSAPMGS